MYDPVTVLVGGENKSEKEWTDFRCVCHTKDPMKIFYYLDLPLVKCVGMAGSHTVPVINGVVLITPLSQHVIARHGK